MLKILYDIIVERELYRQYINLYMFRLEILVYSILCVV